jgi:hypothetical protein
MRLDLGGFLMGSTEFLTVLAADPDAVRESERASLAPVKIDLLVKMKSGVSSFMAAGAEQAYCLGLVNAVCEPEELLPRVRVVAQGIAARGPVAVAEAKRAIDRGYDLPLDVANELEREIFAGLFATHDQKEGMAAFVAKREPKFENR